MRISSFTQSNGKRALDIRELSEAEARCIQQFVMHLEFCIENSRADINPVKKITITGTMDLESSRG